MDWNAKWIKTPADFGDVCPLYFKCFAIAKTVAKATLSITAMGVYQIRLNGERVTDAVLMPGWTVYGKRLQVQEYDVTACVKSQNCLEVTVGKGWYRSPMPGWISEERRKRLSLFPPALTAKLILTYNDGTQETFETDTTWKVRKSPVLFSEIYDGECYDARLEDTTADLTETSVEFYDYKQGGLIEQQGEYIREQERVAARQVFKTPAGEMVVDFGQEVTGYVEFTVDAKAGERVEISHAEVMDKEGNFYTENYRGAKAKLTYICKDGVQTWHPCLTFFGFRYIRLDDFPGEVKAEQFTAIAVYSDMKRTGYIKSGHSLLNQLFQNVIWGQKGNFVDVPTDCPQRDERMGWTGDAQAFIKTASYNYDVERFFTKWLADMALDQLDNGAIPHFIPAADANFGSAAWDDAATICPWQIYMTYGNAEILRRQYGCMTKYVNYITNTTHDRYLWTGKEHYGDWLGLDAPEGSYKGSTREDFIASAFYAYSTSLVIKAGKVLGEDVHKWEVLYDNIVKTFRAKFLEYTTQTEYVLALHFHLTPNREETMKALVEKIHADGDRLMTGFVGTPYLLHVLSEGGATELAYKLLLREEYPSWLYPVTKGATTVWEHWDGIKPDGSFWSKDMNSYNHYAYGAVVDWIYEVAAGITPLEPGFARARIAPHPSKELGWLSVRMETRHGTIVSEWKYKGDNVCYEIETPVETQAVIGGVTYMLCPGKYIF